MALPAGTLVRIIDHGVEHCDKGEYGRYSHPALMVGETHHSVAVARSHHTRVYEHQMEVVPGYLELKPGDKVFIATRNPNWHGVPFTVKNKINSYRYRIISEKMKMDTMAYLTELIPVHVDNTHVKHLLEKEEWL